MTDCRFLPVETPPALDRRDYADATEAVARLRALYDQATGFLLENFTRVLHGAAPQARYRAFYPDIRLIIPTHGKVDSRLSFGHVVAPGV